MLKKKQQHSVNKGLLDAVPLIGLESSELSKTLQNYNDETSDI